VTVAALIRTVGIHGGVGTTNKGDGCRRPRSAAHWYALDGSSNDGPAQRWDVQIWAPFYIGYTSTLPISVRLI